MKHGAFCTIHKQNSICGMDIIIIIIIIIITSKQKNVESLEINSEKFDKGQVVLEVFLRVRALSIMISSLNVKL
jgi:hypothetical protein